MSFHTKLFIIHTVPASSLEKRISLYQVSSYINTGVITLAGRKSLKKIVP